MDSKVQIWIYASFVLISLVCLVQSFEETRKKIPYDVVLPPGDKGESLTPVIMLHGLMDWRKSWERVSQEIAKNTGRKVYAYDALNHGENKWSDEMNINILTTELEQFMQQVNISKAILIGHSLGGKTVMNYALKKPENVEKLIVEDISPRKPTPRIRMFMKQGFLFVKIALSEFSSETDLTVAKKLSIRFMEQILSAQQIALLDKNFLMEWVPIIKRDDKIELLSNLNLFIKLGNTKETDELDTDLLGTFKGRALFIYGGKSPFDVGSDELIPKYFPTAKMIQIKKSNHFIHFEFEKDFLHEVSNYINEP